MSLTAGNSHVSGQDKWEITKPSARGNCQARV